MGWIIRVEVATASVDMISALLWDLNTTGIAETVPARPAPRSQLVAGFERHDQATTAADVLRAQSIDGVGTATIEPIEADEWIDPGGLGRLQVDGTELSFDVGPAFGHGGHVTTRLALELLADLLPPGGSLLDFGTGTGVLSLAALARGAGRVVAVENDPAALAVATANLIETPPPRGRQASGIVEVVTALPSLDPPAPVASSPFDVVVANVLLSVHAEHGPALTGHLHPGRTLIVSGVLVDQEADVLSAYRGLRVAERRHDGEWLGLALRPGGGR